MTTSTAPLSELRTGLHEFRLDLPLTHATAHHHDLLRTSAFPPFQQSAARAEQSLEEMQKQDPLATQIWKFYAKTKLLLPAQERMENLTWRMMHLKLHQARAGNAAKWVIVYLVLNVFGPGMLTRSYLKSPAPCQHGSRCPQRNCTVAQDLGASSAPDGADEPG